MLAIVCWAAKPTIRPIKAVEARTPVASRLNSVNWLRTIIAITIRIATTMTRRRIRNLVRVVRETCETAGDMEGKLTVDPVAEPPPSRFPYANWGPVTALVGVLVALAAGTALAFPAAILGQKPHSNDLTTFGNVGVQLATALGFLLVPMAIAGQRGASGMEILRRLGVRPFRPSALKWMAAAIGAYLVFATFYSLVIVQPEQKDISEGFGEVPVQGMP